ncbi:MAG TPA: hypothetical protein VF221_18480 [Chloroflexota bacterium]
MHRGALRRIFTVLTLTILATALAVVPQLTRSTPASAAPATTLSVCGVVTAYVPATNISMGEIIIGGTPYFIAPGAVVSVSGVTNGTNACLTATLDTGGQIAAGTLVANLSTNVSVCGTLTSFVAPSSTVAGSLTIGGQTFSIAPSTSLSLVGVLFVGSSYCLNGTLNTAGQLVSGTLTTGTATAINVCGVVTSYVPATAGGFGSITIGGQTYTIAPGVVLGGSSASVFTVCLTGSVNGAGQITSGSFTTVVNTTTPVSVCGTLSAYTAPTASSAGSIMLNGQTYLIALGTAVGGSGALVTGGTYCLTGSLNAGGQLISGTITAVVLGPVNVCGVVTAYTLATSTNAGSITIGGQSYAIAPGVTLTGSALLSSGPNPTLCLQAGLGTSGQISSGSLSTSTVGGASTQNVCGAVTAYTPASSTAGGSITVGGNTFSILAGAVFVGAAQPAVGTSVCLTLTLNSSNAIVGGVVVTTSTGVPLSATPVYASARSRAFATPA